MVLNRCVALLLTLYLACSTLAAQVDEEEPIPPRRGSPTKIGGGAGITPFWLFLDYAPINQTLAAANAGQLGTGPLPLFGGQGYGYILFVPNLRIGGLGVGGSRTAESFETVGGTTIRRKTKLSVGFGGVTVDYVVPVMPRFDLTIGTLLGGGGMELKLTRDQGGPKDWGTLWNSYGGGSSETIQEYGRTLKGSFFAYQPNANVEVAVLRWLGVRVGVSYLGMAGGSWTLDDEFDVANVPDAIKGSGWMINGGLFVGTFIF